MCRAQTGSPLEVGLGFVIVIMLQICSTVVLTCVVQPVSNNRWGWVCCAQAGSPFGKAPDPTKLVGNAVVLISYTIHNI